MAVLESKIKIDLELEKLIINNRKKIEEVTPLYPSIPIDDEWREDDIWDEYDVESND